MAAPTSSTTKGVIDALNEGLTLDYRQLKTLADEYCDGNNMGHVNFGISTGRIEPETMISKLDQKKTQNSGFLFLLSYMIRNGLDPNTYFFTGVANVKVHIAAFIATRVYTSRYADCIYDLLSTAGASFLSLAYTGAQNNQNETVEDIIKKNSPGKIIIDPEKMFDLNEILNSKQGEFVIRWSTMKQILLDQTYIKGKSDVLGFLTDVGEGKKFVMRAIVNYLTSRAFSVNCIRETEDRDLIMNTSGNMSQTVYFAILSENLEYFKVIMDKGAECDYLCMTELIARHNDASEKRDKILVQIFGDMIEYAVSTGAEIDGHQIQYLSLHGSVELIENIRDNYREPEWKKLCSRVTPGDKKQIPVKRLRQIAFDLNLDFNLSPTFICEKLDQISNMDRVDFATKSIERQQERVERILMEAGKIREGDPLERRRCNPKSMIINNPYAYNDSRMAFYKDDSGELWCFTSDFFESMIQSKKNPYTGKALPQLFLETIKTQMNILKFLDLASPRDNINMGQAVGEIFDGQREIGNAISEEFYVSAINIIMLLGVRSGSGGGGTGFRLSESDIRSISLKNKEDVLRKFINLSFYFSVNSDDVIELDFTKDPFRLAQDVIERFKPDGILWADPVSFTYDMETFLISRLFRRCKYVEKIPKSGFNELFFRVVSYHILHFYKNYKNGEMVNGAHYYTEGTDAEQLNSVYKSIFT